MIRRSSLVVVAAASWAAFAVLAASPGPAGSPAPDRGGGGGPTEGAGAPSTTSFTYQGELKQAGVPAAGSFAMSFTLWTSETGGSQLGGPLSFPGVDVTDGRFAVELDFGVDALRGGPSWLQITVEGFTLSPRQAITPAPFSVSTRGIDVDGAGRVGIGTEASDQAQLSVGSDGPPAIRAVSETGGRVELATPTAALTSTAADPDGWAAILEGRSQLGTRAFVGRDEVITSAEYFGVQAPVTVGYGGMYVGTDGAAGWPFYGYATDGVPRAWTTYQASDEAWRLYVNGRAQLEVTDGDVRGPTGALLPVAALNVGADGEIISGSGEVLGVEIIDDRYIIEFPPGTTGLGPVVVVTCLPTSAGLVPYWNLFDLDRIEVTLLEPGGTSQGQTGSFSIVVFPDRQDY